MLESQRQVNLCEIVASMVYIVTFQNSQSNVEIPCLNKQTGDSSVSKLLPFKHEVLSSIPSTHVLVWAYNSRGRIEVTNQEAPGPSEKHCLKN